MGLIDHATTSSITIKGGKIYLSVEMYDTYFAGRDSAALIKWQGDLLLLPVVSQAQGGLLIKITNLRGDRVVDAVDVLRRLDVSDAKTFVCSAQWSSEMSGLVLQIPDAGSRGGLDE